MDKKYTIEHQFDLYLERCEVTKQQLSPIQYSEMKRAFFGAWGQLLILQREDLGDLADLEGDDKAADILQDMMNQAVNFWLAEKGKEN